MKACLFAHYDPTHRVRPHVVDYTRALVDAGFTVAVASSSTIRPPSADLAPFEQMGVQFVWRPNTGLDFGAWRELMRQGHADGAEAVLLANDSVFGPFGDLQRVIRRMCRRRYDAWGMVESLQSGWHLQSWFIYLSARALARPGVRAVFEQPFETMTKDEIIRNGELGLGRALRAERLRCGAVNRSLLRRALVRLVPASVNNPSHLDWRHFLVTGKVPFLKAELVRDNPLAIAWADEWHDVIERRLGYPTDSVSAYLYEYADRPPRDPDAPFRPPAGKPFRAKEFVHYAIQATDWRIVLRHIRTLPKWWPEDRKYSRDCFNRATAPLRVGLGDG